MPQITSGWSMAASTRSPQMATVVAPRAQVRNRVANDHGIRVDENVANHEPEDLLAFADRRMGGRVGSAQLPLEV
jgi:hypothetical protein